MRVTHTMKPTPQTTCQRLECTGCRMISIAATAIICTDPERGRGIGPTAKKIAEGKIKLQVD